MISLVWAVVLCSRILSTAPVHESLLQIDGSKQNSFDAPVLHWDILFLSTRRTFHKSTSLAWKSCGLFCSSCSTVLAKILETKVVWPSPSKNIRGVPLKIAAHTRYIFFELFFSSRLELEIRVPLLCLYCFDGVHFNPCRFLNFRPCKYPVKLLLI